MTFKKNLFSVGKNPSSLMCISMNIVIFVLQMKNCICSDSEVKNDINEGITRSEEFLYEQIDESVENLKFETSQANNTIKTTDYDFGKRFFIVQSFLNYINPFFCSEDKTNEKVDLTSSSTKNQPDAKKEQKCSSNASNSIFQPFCSGFKANNKVNCSACNEKIENFMLKTTFTKHIFCEAIQFSTILPKLTSVKLYLSGDFMLEFFKPFLSFNLKVCLEFNEKIESHENKFYETFIQYSCIDSFLVNSCLERPLIIAKIIAINEYLKYRPGSESNNILTQIIRKICFCMKADVLGISSSFNIINAIINASMDNNLLEIESPLLYKFLFKKILIKNPSFDEIKVFLSQALLKSTESTPKMFFFFKICCIISTVSKEFEIFIDEFFAGVIKHKEIADLLSEAKDKMIFEINHDNFLQEREINEINEYFFISDMNSKTLNATRDNSRNGISEDLSKIKNYFLSYFDKYNQNRLAHFTEFEHHFIIICFLDENMEFFIENPQIFFDLCKKQEFEISEYMKNNLKVYYSGDVSINLKWSFLFMFLEKIQNHFSNIENIFRNCLLMLLKAYQMGYKSVFGLIILNHYSKNVRLYNIATLLLELIESSFGSVIELLSFTIHIPPIDPDSFVFFTLIIIKKLPKYLNEFNKKSACIIYLIIRGCSQVIESHENYIELLGDVKEIVFGFKKNPLFFFLVQDIKDIKISTKKISEVFESMICMKLNDEYDAQNFMCLLAEFIGWFSLDQKKEILTNFNKAIFILENSKCLISSKLALFVSESISKELYGEELFVEEQ